MQSDLAAQKQITEGLHLEAQRNLVYTAQYTHNYRTWVSIWEGVSSFWNSVGYN